MSIFFFFQAEDGIRDFHVTGVQTCALPILCLADVPKGALAWLMETDTEALIAGAKESLTQAVTELGGADPIGLLTFDCGARKVMLGADGMRQEVAAMTSVIGDAPFGGFYTYGEIARTNGA